MAIAVSITKTDITLDHEIVTGSLTFTGTIPATGNGDLLSFAGFDQIKTPALPRRVRIFECPVAGTAATGLVPIFAQGATQATHKVMIFNGVTQQVNVTYTSLGISTLYFEAWFSRT